MSNLANLLVKHEGLLLKPYTDTVGKLTIGCGRNLNDVGIGQPEAMIMLANDIARVSQLAVDNFAWFNSISSVRQDVVLSMIFNMGLGGFKEFTKLLAALQNGDFKRASDEMLSSKWAGQVGARASELAQMLIADRYL